MGTMTLPRPAGGGANGASRRTSAAHPSSSWPPFHWSTPTCTPLPLASMSMVNSAAAKTPVCAYFAVCSQLCSRGRIASMATYADAA